jgi:hypothetical protein
MARACLHFVILLFLLFLLLQGRNNK